MNKQGIATFIALLFHVSGCIGMFTEKRDWFVQHTPLNLLIVFVLIIWTQSEKNKAFILFVLIAFVTGMVAEMIGVHTGLLFGNYRYGNVLGAGVNEVPFLIGINWFVVVYCSGVAANMLHQWIIEKRETANKPASKWLMFLSLVVDTAILATFFDWVMEPIAIKLGFWTWNNGEIPLYNYLCWFVISAGLATVFKLLRFNKHNQFAVHLLLIQLLFFGVLRTFLS